MSNKVCTHVERNLSTQAMDIDKGNDKFESQTKLAKVGGNDDGDLDSTMITNQEKVKIGGDVKRRLTCKHPDGCNFLRKKDGLCTSHWLDEFELQSLANFYSTTMTNTQEQPKTHLRPMKTAEEVLPKGVTFRPSGKWQVQLFYAGQSRYLGMFPSKEAAAMAYELALDCAIQLGDDRRTWRKLSPEQTKANVITLRKAAAGALMTTDNTQQQAIPVHRIVPRNEEKAPVVVVDEAASAAAEALLYFASHSVIRETRVDVTSA